MSSLPYHKDSRCLTLPGRTSRFSQTKTFGPSSGVSGEAELRRHGLSAIGCELRAGHQNASDGGIDVRVSADTALPATSAIQRSNVGYQVKAEDIPRGKILAEMRPDDILRVSIQELATLCGSYIIVSSKGSVSYTALRERKRAMKDAVADLPNSNDLHLDFYDRDRVATWVRDHHGITTWVRERIGRPITGWRPYEDWVGSQEGVTGEYLVDDQLRIQGPHLKGDSLPALEGMERIRAVLSGEQGVVRLVGLSGTGKTRLAQALFDDRVGASGLALGLGDVLHERLSGRSKSAAGCCRHRTGGAASPASARHRQLPSGPPQKAL